MKKFIIAMAVVAATSSLAVAGQNGEGCQGHQGRRQLAANLNLTDAQKQQLTGIRKADREKNKALYESFRQKRQELRQLRDNNDPRAKSMKAEMQAMRDQVRAAREAMRDQVRGMLTPEQQQLLDQAPTDRGR